MSKNQKHRSTKEKVFTSPGSLIYVGKEVNGKAKAKLLRFNASEIEEKKISRLSDFVKPPKDDNLVDWLNIEGVHDVLAVEALGKNLGFHPLLQEDILNTEQKPKLEQFGEQHIFLVLKSLRLNPTFLQIETEHLALVLGDDYIISFHENGTGDVFHPVESRLKSSVGKTRRSKADYLFYSLCDVVVDSYFVLLEDFSEKLEDLELRIIETPSARDQKALYAYRRELFTIRKAVYPLRDIFGALVRDDSPLIKDATNVYFRDVYDHVLQVLEMIDSYREMIENIQNIYLNNLSNKMNSVMKTLTVFTAIFMPLTFIVGIYGMNFDNMPELRNPNGYFFTLGGMALLGVCLWVYFKWKKYM